MYKHWEKQLTANKFLETEVWTGISASRNKWFDLSLRWTTEMDNAGIKLKFSICKALDVVVSLYDQRHWNEHTGNWHTERSWLQEIERTKNRK